MRLIIPTAKVIPAELQSVGKIPAVVYPIGQKIVFDYLYAHYQGHAHSCRIIAHDNIQAVQHQLRKYLSHATKIVELSNLGDLGDTIQAGLPERSTSLIVNFGDTILDDTIPEGTKDCFFYAVEDSSARWTSFTEQNGTLTNIYDKGESRPHHQTAHIFVGVFLFSDSSLLTKCLLLAQKERAQNALYMDTFYRAVQLYSQTKPLKSILAEHWFDIGHLDRYHDSSLEVKARTFNHISIDRNRGMLRKTSDNKDKFTGEIKWYLKLPTDIEYVRPRIFSYSLAYDNPYVVMEYYAYHTLHELFVYGDLTDIQWRTIFKRILFILTDLQRYRVHDPAIHSALKEMYWDKTLERIQKLRLGTNKKYFENFFTHKITLNGRQYLSLTDCSRLIEQKIPKMLLDEQEFTIIHGDLCFANIMIDEQLSFLKLIDPRGKFGKFDIYGDPRYELAKLFHSVDGKYDFIIKDQFNIQVDAKNAIIDYALHRYAGRTLATHW